MMRIMTRGEQYFAHGAVGREISEDAAQLMRRAQAPCPNPSAVSQDRAAAARSHGSRFRRINMEMCENERAGIKADPPELAIGEQFRAANATCDWCE